MIKVVFVCHGNICRSPMAEFVFKDMADKAKLSQLFCIESRAGYTDAIGCPAHEGTRKKLAEHGISCSGKRAALLKKSDQDFDYIIGMDDANIARIRHILGSDADGKLFKLMDFSPRPSDIADPWYTGDFQTTYYDIYEGCKGLLEYIINKDIKNSPK